MCYDSNSSALFAAIIKGFCSLPQLIKFYIIQLNYCVCCVLKKSAFAAISCVQHPPSSKFISLPNFQTFSPANSLDWAQLLFTESGNSRPNVGRDGRKRNRKEQVGGCFCWRFLLMVCAHSLLFPPTSKQPTDTHAAAFASVPPGGGGGGETLRSAVILNAAARQICFRIRDLLDL